MNFVIVLDEPGADGPKREFPKIIHLPTAVSPGESHANPDDQRETRV